MEPGFGALLALLVLGFVPGALLYRTLRPAGSSLELAALAPTLSFALIFLFGEFTTTTGVPFAPVPFVALLGLLAVTAAIRSYRTRKRSAAPRHRSAVDRSAALLLLAGIALTSLTWFFGLHGLATTPPATDSVNHGVMAAQVASLESLDPGRVLTSDILGAPSETAETSFYPLALHGEVALAHRLFGISFADGLLTSTFLFSVLAVPIGIFFAVQVMFPKEPRLAGLAALSSGTVGFVPILPLSFGGLPLLIGLAMVPPVAVVIVRALMSRSGPSGAAVAVLSGVGILATHTSEIPLLAVMVGLATVEACWRREVHWATVLRRGRVLGVSTLLLIAPTLPQLAGGTAERSGIDEGHAVSLLEAAGDLSSVVGFQREIDILGLLAVAGAVLCLKRKRHLALVGTVATVLTLYFIAACATGPITAVTVPWYQHPGRIALNLFVVEPLLAAIALMEIGPWLQRFVPAQRGRRSVAAPALVVAGLLAASGLAVNTSALRTLLVKQVRVGDEALAAFAFLDARVQPGERVLNDGISDGGMWMYPFEGLVPLMGLQPARPGDSWHERRWLVSHLPDLGQDPKVDELLTKYNVRFVYYDDRHFELNPHQIDRSKFGSVAGLCPRFNEGTVWVFEVTPGTVCSAGSLAGQ